MRSEQIPSSRITCSLLQLSAVVALPLTAYVVTKIFFGKSAPTAGGNLVKNTWSVEEFAAGLTAVVTITGVVAWKALHKDAAEADDTAVEVTSANQSAPEVIEPVETTTTTGHGTLTAPGSSSNTSRIPETFEALIAPPQEKTKFGSPKPDSSTTNELAIRKMRKSLAKAFVEGCENAAQAKRLFQDVQSKENCAIQFGKTSAASAKGVRRSHEDAHCERKIDGVGQFYGVFDGHGEGGVIARQLANELPELVSHHYQEAGNAYNAFHRAFAQMQHMLKEQHVPENGPPFEGGSTAVLCFIPEGSSIVYTATLGDSEAKVYRPGEDGDGWVALPLSLARGWDHPTEEARFVQAWTQHYQSQGIEEDTIRSAIENWKQAEDRRANPTGGGLNVARSFADFDEITTGAHGMGYQKRNHGQQWDAQKLKRNPGQTILSSKPKVTAMPLCPGKLVVACDGLWNFAKKGSANAADLAEQLGTDVDADSIVQRALNDYQSKDNVTVVIVTLEETRSA